MVVPSHECLLNSGELSLANKEQQLRKWFIYYATVIDSEKKYISAPGVNQRIKAPYNGYAADLVADWASDKGCTIAIPVSTMGSYLGSVVADKLGIDIAPNRKDGARPDSWRTPITTGEFISFTTDKTVQITVNGLNKQDKVLIVDDILYRADTVWPLIKALKEFGIPEIYVAFYFVKLFGPGLKILEEAGIPCHYVIGVEDVTPSDQIILTPPHYSHSVVPGGLDVKS